MGGIGIGASLVCRCKVGVDRLGTMGAGSGVLTVIWLSVWVA